MNLPVIFQSLCCFNLMTFDLLYFCNGSNVRAGCQAAAGVSRLSCVNVQSKPALCRNKAEMHGRVYTSVHRSVLFMAFWQLWNYSLAWICVTGNAGASIELAQMVWKIRVWEDGLLLRSWSPFNLSQQHVCGTQEWFHPYQRASCRPADRVVWQQALPWTRTPSAASLSAGPGFDSEFHLLFKSRPFDMESGFTSCWGADLAVIHFVY